MCLFSFPTLSIRSPRVPALLEDLHRSTNSLLQNFFYYFLLRWAFIVHFLDITGTQGEKDCMEEPFCAQEMLMAFRMTDWDWRLYKLSSNPREGEWFIHFSSHTPSDKRTSHAIVINNWKLTSKRTCDSFQFYVSYFYKILFLSSNNTTWNNI